MRLGIFQMPLHPPHRQLQETLKEDADKIVYADELGFHEAWVGEHFSATTEPISAPLIFMATLIEKTKNIKFATGVRCLPNHHPAIVAGEVALFDHLAKGRFIFGIGTGGLASDMELFGNLDGGIRNERMIESIGTILKIWSQDPPYDIQGKHWHVKITDTIVEELGVGYMSKPFQQPHPPIALSSMSPGSNTVKAAAQRGWSPVTANFSPETTVISHWAKYVEGCEAAGREPTGDEWRVARNIVVAESDQQAEDWVFDNAGSNFYYFDYLWKVLSSVDFTHIFKSDPDVPDKDITIKGLIQDMVIYGSPKTVANKLLSLRERAGPFGTLLMASMDESGANHARERETMRRLATEVMPEVRKAIG